VYQYSVRGKERTIKRTGIKEYEVYDFKNNFYLGNVCYHPKIKKWVAHKFGYVVADTTTRHQAIYSL